MASRQLTEVRDALPDILKRAEEGEHIVIEREGREVAALVSIEDLRLLEHLEDSADLLEGLKALEEETDEAVDWETAKKWLASLP